MDFFYQIWAEGWKLWLMAGIVFFVAEGANPGTFSLFFGGLGALATALSCRFSPDVAERGTWQLLIFAAASLSSFLLFRPAFVRFTRNGPKLSDAGTFWGKRGKALSILHKNGFETGQVLFEGTEWTALPSGNSPDTISAGTAVEVVRIDGLTLYVQPVQEEK